MATEIMQAYMEREVRWWQEFFGLNTWRIDVSAETLSETSYAEVEIMSSSRIGKIMWNTLTMTVEQIEINAFHEVAEIVLWDLGLHSDDDGVNHTFIRRWENSMFKQIQALKTKNPATHVERNLLCANKKKSNKTNKRAVSIQ